jgi:hypothetical protein
MDRAQQGSSPEGEHVKRAPLNRGMGWGLIGGLSGTLVMDILLMGALSAVGLPAFLCYSIVGDTVARFFSLQGMDMAGGVPTGAAAHYLIGPLVGLLLGTALVMFPALRVVSLKKCIILSILYVEILSQPILLTTPMLLKISISETLLWFGGSFVMHMILAVVLGAVIGYGLHLTPSTQRRVQ